MVSRILSLYTCMKERGWACPGTPIVSVDKCVLIEGTIIHVYVVKGWERVASNKKFFLLFLCILAYRKHVDCYLIPNINAVSDLEIF